MLWSRIVFGALISPSESDGRAKHSASLSHRTLCIEDATLYRPPLQQARDHSFRNSPTRTGMGAESEGAAALANKRAILVAVDDSEVGSMLAKV